MPHEYSGTNAATDGRLREDRNFRANATALANEEQAARRQYQFDQGNAVDAAALVSADARPLFVGLRSLFAFGTPF